MYIPITITAVAVVAGYCYYRHIRKRPTEIVSDELDQNEIQRVGTLSIDNVLEWVNKSLENCQPASEELELNILPNKATLEVFKDKLDLNPKDLSQCYLILILDKEQQTQLKRKLVIAGIIGDGLEALSRDKVFVINLK